MNLQTHYAQLVEREYAALEKPRRYSWKVSMWLLGRNDAVARWAIFGSFQAVFIACMTLLYGIFRLVAPVLGDGEGLLFALILIFGGFALYCWGMSRRDRVLSILEAHNPSPMSRYELRDLMEFLNNDKRLQAIVTGMLRTEGTEQLTQAQGYALLKSAKKIKEWNRLESTRAEGIVELEKLGLVTLARAEKRAETLETFLPAPATNAPTKQRF